MEGEEDQDVFRKDKQTMTDPPSCMCSVCSSCAPLPAPVLFRYSAFDKYNTVRKKDSSRNTSQASEPDKHGVACLK